MLFGLSPIAFFTGSAVAFAVIIAGGVFLLKSRGGSEPEDRRAADGRELKDLVFERGDGDDAVETERIEEVVVDDDGAVEIPPPNVSTSTFGLAEEFFRFYRRRSKERKLARKGYVKWHLAGETFSQPKFIKPEEKGGGMLEFEHDGQTYLFPRDAALADQSNGMWTFVHKPGESDPINLRDPLHTSIPADALKNYLTMRVSTDKPGWLSSLNLDPQDLMLYGMGAIVVFAVLNRMVF